MARIVTFLRSHLAVTVVIAMVLSATAYAALDPIGGDGDVDACFEKKGGELSLLTKKKKCPRGSKAVSWVQTGPRGPAGPPGPPGLAGRSALQTLRSGETVRGAIGQQVNAAGASDEFYLLGSMPIPAPEPLTDVDVIVDGDYEDSATCQGSFAAPTAPAGKLCIYGSLGDTVGLNTEEEEGTAAGRLNGPATPYGFAIRFYSEAGGEAAVAATWAYRAP